MYRRTLLTVALTVVTLCSNALDVKTKISIKQPGNPAVTYSLKEDAGQLVSANGSALPIEIKQQVTNDGKDQIYQVTLTARQTAFYNFEASLNTGLPSNGSEFYLPGFWYHLNLRSPKEAPAFHTSKSWNFREDRLSSPMASAFNESEKKSIAVMRCLDSSSETLTTHTSGEVILSGETSLGYLGFDSEHNDVALTFGYPYIETPKRYIRKLTLIAPIFTYAKLEKGKSKTITWRIIDGSANNYGEHVTNMWKKCFDIYNPQPLAPLFGPDEIKKGLCNYFRRSYIDRYPLKYHSGHTLLTSDCKPYPAMQIGFCGRVLLNAFNAIEYGEQHQEKDLVNMGNEILESFLQHGFTSAGYFYDDVNFNKGFPTDEKAVHSIRQQSEAVYAILLYLKYEKSQGRKHAEWENHIKQILDGFLKLQRKGGNFARKFHDDGSDIDASGGSTPSATSALVMGYRYFGKKQ